MTIKDFPRKVLKEFAFKSELLGIYIYVSELPEELLDRGGLSDLCCSNTVLSFEGCC